MGLDEALTSAPTSAILEVIQTGYTSLPSMAIDDSQHVDVTHNLGYEPIVLAYRDFDGSLEEFNGVKVYGLGSGASQILESKVRPVTPTTVTFRRTGWTDFASVDTYEAITIKYYLLRVKAK